MNKGLPVQPIRLLSNEDMARIHDGSCAILEQVGARVRHPRMLGILEEAGLPVDHENERVGFPRASVEGFIERAKKKRESLVSPSVANELPGEIRLSLGGGQALIYDDVRGEIRSGLKSDLEQATIIGDYYPEIKTIANMIHPTDVPGPVSDIHMWDVLLRRTKKFANATVTNKGSIKYIMEMLAVVVGSVDEVRKRHMFRKICFVYSPLTVPREDLEVAFEMLDAGMDVVIGHAMPSMGIHAPITICGALASVNAEALAGLVMTEALNQDFVVPYHCATACAINPRTAITLAATPEFMQINAACAEMARYYGLGGDGFYGAGHTDAPVPDYQAGFEVGASMMIGVFSGCSGFSAGTLGPAHEVVSLSKIPLDVDCAGYVNRWLRQIRFDEDTLALDTIINVERGDGNFIAEEHTVKHLRDECWEPRIFTRLKPSEYMARGRDLAQSARAEIDEILKNHDPHPLSPEQEKELSKIVKACEKAKGVG